MRCALRLSAGGAPWWSIIAACSATTRSASSAAAGRARILGADLTLHAMDRDTLIVTGRIAAVEYA